MQLSIVSVSAVPTNNGGENPEGLLSPEKNRAIMERLKGSVDPTDILERQTVVVESVTESPLTKGTKSLCSTMVRLPMPQCSKPYRMPETISTLKLKLDSGSDQRRITTG
jgi:hypothetical protein